MSRLTRPVLLAFAAATLLGACLHFVYALIPCPATALLSPVNESIWEHVKLLYWPGLIASLLLARREPAGTLGLRCLFLLLGTAVMLLAGYAYHILLGGDALGFDITLYVAVMALALLGPLFPPPAHWAARTPLLVLLVIALGVALALFTFLPPALTLFADLSGANTWATLPC